MLFSALGALAGTGAAAAAGGAGLAASTVGAAGAATGLTSAIGAAGTAASLVGTGMGVYGQMQATKASERQEQVREGQMKLEAARERRAIARQAVVARSEALNAATAQGAQFGSGLQGGIAQVSGEAARATTAVNQNEAIGSTMFKLNRDLASAQTISSLGSGLQGFGNNLVSNQELYGRVGTYWTG